MEDNRYLIDEIAHMKRLMFLREEKSEMQMGVDVEKEHDPTYKKIKDYYKEHNDFPDKKMVFKWIAEDHLEEFKDYYTRLAKMEKEAKSEDGTRTSIITQDIKDQVQKMLDSYGNKKIPDRVVHGIADKNNIETDELESYIYGLAAKNE